MKKNGVFYMAMALMFVIIASTAMATQTITIYPAKDSFVQKSTPDINYGATTSLKVRSFALGMPDPNQRTYIQFPLDLIPNNMQIVSAKLKLYMYDAPWLSRTYLVNRVNSNWQEGTITYANQPAVVLPSTSNTTTGSDNSWLVFDVTGDVRAMYNGASPNFGWRIRDYAESGAFNYEAFFYSKQYFNYHLIPRLEVIVCSDFDQDGYMDSACGGDDWNDNDSAVYPGAPELCDGKDNNQNTAIDEGFALGQACTSGTGACFGAGTTICSQDKLSTICNATAASPVHEICNGLDDDCDGIVDDNLIAPLNDEQAGMCAGSVKRCMGAEGWVNDYTSVSGYGVEVCDGIDNDCDGIIDEENSADCTTYYYDGDHDGFGTTASKCLCAPSGNYTANNPNDCDDTNPAINPSATEIYDNGIDENCDGRANKAYDSECTSYVDATQDMLALNQTTTVSITVKNVGLHSWSQANYYNFGLIGQDMSTWGITRADINPAVTVHSGESYTFTFQIHAPNFTGVYGNFWEMRRDNFTGFGDICGQNITVIYDCKDEDHDGFYGKTLYCPQGNDCDDSNPLVNPGMAEVCNGIDDNCDGIVDNIDETQNESSTLCTRYYYDLDGDNYGTGDFRCICSPSGNYRGEHTADCNDAAATIYPGAPELCNGIDDNCDGTIPANEADADLDGFRICQNDCNDANALINPNATEICNGVDDNCNGVIDEENATGCSQFYYDGDRDTFGTNVSKCLCAGAGNYTSNNANDCNDNSAISYPLATEICDELDNDCDSTVDEGCPLYDAECTVINIPNGVVKNIPTQASVTMKNLGTFDWTTGSVQLRNQSPDVWGINAVDLTSEVPVFTGSSYTFTFNVMPTSLGTSVPFDWQMFRIGDTWFGDICHKNVNVVELPDVTIATVPVAPNANGWFTVLPNITLTNTTTNMNIYYKWNSLTWQLYSAPLRGYDGINTLMFYGKDIYNNSGPMHTVQFNVDRQAPNIRAFRPFNNTKTNNTQIRIWVRYDDIGLAGIDTLATTISIDSVDVSASASIGTSSLEYIPSAPLSEGNHTVEVHAVDNAGNTATLVFVFTVDTTAPLITITSPIDLTVYGARNQMLSINLDEQATRLNLAINGGRETTLCRYCTVYSRLYSFYEGLDNIAVIAYDAVGNRGEKDIAVTIDAAAPSIYRQTPSSRTRVKDVTTFTVLYQESAVKATDGVLLFYRNGTNPYLNKSIAGCPSGSSVSCDTTIDLTGLAVGSSVSYYFRITDSFDRVSNGATQTLTITA